MRKIILKQKRGQWSNDAMIKGPYQAISIVDSSTSNELSGRQLSEQRLSSAIM